MAIKIVHFTTLTTRGGVESRLLSYLRQRRSAIYTHVVAGTSASPDLLKELDDLTVAYCFPARTFRYDIRVLYSLAAWLRVQKADVIHCRNESANIWGALLARYCSIPILIGGEYGTVWIGRPPRSWLQAWAYWQTNAVIAVSAAAATMLRFRYGIPASRIRIIYDGTDPVQFDRSIGKTAVRKQFNIAVHSPIIGSVGRLDTEKGFDILLDAACRVCHENPASRFLLMGDGPLRGWLEQKIINLGLSGKVLLTGWRHDIPELLPGLDLFVSTSLRESLGNAIIEAQMAGVAVIAPQIDGPGEFLIDGETARLLQPRSGLHTAPPGGRRNPRYSVVDGEIVPARRLEPEDVSQAILELIEHPERREQLAERGRVAVLNRFSMNRYVGELENLYSEFRGTSGESG